MVAFNEKEAITGFSNVSRMKRSLWRFLFQVAGIHERYYAAVSDFSCRRFHTGTSLLVVSYRCLVIVKEKQCLTGRAAVPAGRGGRTLNQ
jgi:hypothetical protein